MQALPPPSPYLSVIVPAYNEELRLPRTIEAIEAFLSSQVFSWELIVMDDGSKDRTVGVANETFSDSRSRVECNPRNLGKGATIRNGMQIARGRFKLFTDADNSTPVEESLKLLRAMKRRGADVAIGSRAIKGSRLEVRQPFYREMMGRVFNLIVQIFAVPGVKDTQCGFKIFSRDAAQYVFPRQQLDGFSFDVEALMLARRGGFKIVEVPIRWIDSPASRVSPFRDSARMFLDVLKVRFRRYD